MKGVQENDPLKMKAEHSKKAINVNSTKVTSFVNGKQVDHLIKHQKLREQKSAKKEGEVEEQVESEGEEEDVVDKNLVVVGSYVFLPEKGHFAMVKSKVDENLYECQIKKSKTE